ncbi:hypothetical protein WBP07_25080 [Novosphingobium sp. BL-8A]
MAIENLRLGDRQAATSFERPATHPVPAIPATLYRFRKLLVAKTKRRRLKGTGLGRFYREF